MWLTLAILAYLFFALAAFLDKYILGGPLPSPKVYSFYAGIWALLVLLVIPFGIFLSLDIFPYLQRLFPEGFGTLFIPSLPLIILSLTTGVVLLLALLSYFKGIYEFEVSRISPAVGGLIPLFILVLVYIFSFISLDLGFERRALVPREYLALSFLILGSVVLTLQREKLATLNSLKISIIASFFFSLALVLTKLVYTYLPFWNGFTWTRLGEFVGAVLLLVFSSDLRKKIFNRKKDFSKEIALPFVFARGAGALGGVLQNGAIFLAPMVFLPLINALSGIQYVFLIILATLLFFKFPRILKEEVSKKVLLQKTLAIWLVVAGLVLLSLS